MAQRAAIEKIGHHEEDLARDRRAETGLQPQLEGVEGTEEHCARSALPGRHDANTVSAMQIQPRPPVISKKKALKADIVRKAPPAP